MRWKSVWTVAFVILLIATNVLRIFFVNVLSIAVQWIYIHIFTLWPYLFFYLKEENKSWVWHLNLIAPARLLMSIIIVMLHSYVFVYFRWPDIPFISAIMQLLIATFCFAHFLFIYLFFCFKIQIHIFLLYSTIFGRICKK